MMCNYSRNPTSTLVIFLIQKPVFVIVITNLFDKCLWKWPHISYQKYELKVSPPTSIFIDGLVCVLSVCLERGRVGGGFQESGTPIGPTQLSVACSTEKQERAWYIFSRE